MKTPACVFVALILSFASATAQDGFTQIANSGRIGEGAAITTDKAGRLHAIAVLDGTDRFPLTHFIFESGEWQAVSEILSSGSNSIYGIDITISEEGTLPASYYFGVRIFHASLSPQSDRWTLTRIGDNA